MPIAETRKHNDIEPETLARAKEVAPNYAALTSDELRQYADHIGAEIRTRMPKGELIKAVAKKASLLHSHTDPIPATNMISPDPDPTPTRPAPHFTDSAPTPSRVPLTQNEIDEYRGAMREWGQKGYPEKAAVLQQCIDEGMVAPPNLLFTGDIKPEKPVRGNVEVPPRMGRGATHAAWQEFILATAEIEPEVVARLSRDDCITMAEAKGIIPRLHETKEDNE